MWDLNDLNTPESEAVQSEREIHETIVANNPNGAGREPGVTREQAARYPVAVAEPVATPADTTVRFKRLRNNAWGITGPSALLREGAEVAVTKRDGSSTTATVSRVIWSGDGKAICSIRRS